jgi:hypothetical protein
MAQCFELSNVHHTLAGYDPTAKETLEALQIPVR